MFHEQNFKRVFPKQQNTKLLNTSTQLFNCRTTSSDAVRPTFPNMELAER